MLYSTLYVLLTVLCTVWLLCRHAGITRQCQGAVRVESVLMFTRPSLAVLQTVFSADPSIIALVQKLRQLWFQKFWYCVFSSKCSLMECWGVGKEQYFEKGWSLLWLVVYFSEFSSVVGLFQKSVMLFLQNLWNTPMSESFKLGSWNFHRVLPPIRGGGVE